MQQPLPERDPMASPVPRRQALRSLLGLVTGLGVLIGLAACGGEEEDEDD